MSLHPELICPKVGRPVVNSRRQGSRPAGGLRSERVVFFFVCFIKKDLVKRFGKQFMTLVLILVKIC